MLGSLFFKFAIFFYVLASAGFIVFTIKQEKKFFNTGFFLLILAFLFHTAFLIYGYCVLGTAPVLDFRSSLSFFSWCIVLVYMIFFLRFRLRILGAFVTPFSTFLVLISSMFSICFGPVKPIFKTVWLTVHVGTIFIGNALFAIAFLAAVMYLLQDYYIKNKKFNFLYERLPSLTTIDTINHYSLIYGFPFLTAGIITGAIYAQIAFGKYWQWDPKEVWSLVTWILYAILIHERLAVGWKGRKAAIMSILCFVVLSVSFIGTSLFIEGYHNIKQIERLGTIG